MKHASPLLGYITCLAVILSVCFSPSIHSYVCVCVYIYIYTYIHAHRSVLLHFEILIMLGISHCTLVNLKQFVLGPQMNNKDFAKERSILSS